MNDRSVDSDIPHRDEDGCLEWWNAALEVRDGRATMTVSFGGFQQQDMPLHVAREAVGFWAQSLG